MLSASSTRTRYERVTGIGLPNACIIFGAISMMLQRTSALTKLLTETEKTHHTGGNVLFYLATPPKAFAVIVRRLGEAGLTNENEGKWRRVIIEKPFGTDLSSAQALDCELLSVLAELQIYRIDHYLGKETVQNIMVFRFANGMFEPLWNRDHIDHVQITVAEGVGVEERGKFYDATGALRDMVPNHLFQLLDAYRDGAAHLFRRRSRPPREGQGARCRCITFPRGCPRISWCAASMMPALSTEEQIVAYRRDSNVAPRLENRDLCRAQADDRQLALGRRALLPPHRQGAARRRTEIVIQFKQVPFALFRDTSVDRLSPNDLVLHIQPEEGVTLQFGAKIPGPRVWIGDVEMKFDYRDYFRVAPNTGYETLLYDCMIGDATLFSRADDIEAGWRVVQPILDAWSESRAAEIPIYSAGSNGPSEADALIARDGRRWRALDDGTSS